MSSICWSENRLVVSIRGQEEELGYIEQEPHSGKYVLWLKDTFGVATSAGSYLKAEEYPSLKAARSRAESPQSIVFIWHLIWMRGVLKREAERELEDNWDEFCADDPDLSKLNKQSAKDGVRAHLDRLASDKVKEQIIKIGKGALFAQKIIEIIKDLPI